MVEFSVICAALPPEGVRAQVSDSAAGEELPEFPSGLGPEGRADVLERWIESDSTRYDLRWRAAREHTAAGLLEAEPEAGERRGYRALHHATRAVALDPSGPEGHYWLALSAGLLADLTGGRTSVRMAERSWREAGWLLQADSLHAGAHHVRGRVQAALQRVNPFLRLLARVLVGAEILAETSWEGAEYHLKRATELSPETPMYHFELALAYRDQDKREEMWAAVAAAIQASGSDTPEVDAYYKKRARQFLFRARGDVLR